MKEHHEEKSSDAEDASGSYSSEGEEEDEAPDLGTAGEENPDYDGEGYDSAELLEMWEADSDSDGEGANVVWTEKMLERVNARKYKWR